MAPRKSSAPKSAEQASTIIGFTSNVRPRIQNPSEDLPALILDLRTHIDLLPIPQSAFPTHDQRHIQEESTLIWNDCTRKQWQEPPEVLRRALCHGKAFTALLLISMQPRGERALGTDQDPCRKPDNPSNGMDRTRLMKVALKTLRDCLDLREVDLIKKLMLACVNLERSLRTPETEIPETSCTWTPSELLMFEHAVLKMTYARQQSRLDIAEQILPTLLAKRPFPPGPDAQLALDGAAILHDIGRDAVERKDFQAALRWLEPAKCILEEYNNSSRDDNSRKLACITHQLIVRSHLALGTAEGRAKASEAFLHLDHFRNEPSVSLLHMEILKSQDNFDAAVFHQALSATVSRLQLNEPIVNIILHHTDQLKGHSVELACNSLDELIRRLVERDESQLLGKCVLKRLFYSMDTSDKESDLSQLIELLTDVSIAQGKALSAEVTTAALVLIWKIVESKFERGHFTSTIAWCNLSRHAVFQRVSDWDLTKFERRIIICALESSDLNLARQTYANMSQTGKLSESTQYLMYKVALADGDDELALQCFENLCHEGTDSDNKFVFGCVFEAQKSQNRHQACLVLQRLLEKYDQGAPPDVNIAALLRCSVRLWVSETHDRPETPEAICNLFELASYHAQKSKGLKDCRVFDIAELEWFSRNSYNLALQNCTLWAIHLVLRLLRSSMELMDLYPEKVPGNVVADLSTRRLFANFLSCALAVTQARSAPKEDPESKLQSYLLVRIHAAQFYQLVTTQLSRFDDSTKVDLIKKYRSVLAFDFEAAARLTAWDALPEIVLQSEEVAEEKLLGIFVDVLLSSEASVATKGFLIMRIVNTSRALPTFNPATISRYIRLVFQLSLSTTITTAAATSNTTTSSDKDSSIALSLLDQAILLAQDTASTSHAYPVEEAEWMATTAWNIAVDFFVAGGPGKEKAAVWGEKAVIMGSLVGDGQLGELLRERLGRMTLVGNAADGEGKGKEKE